MNHWFGQQNVWGIRSDFLQQVHRQFSERMGPSCFKPFAICPLLVKPECQWTIAELFSFSSVSPILWNTQQEWKGFLTPTINPIGFISEFLQIDFCVKLAQIDPNYSIPLWLSTSPPINASDLRKTEGRFDWRRQTRRKIVFDMSKLVATFCGT